MFHFVNMNNVIYVQKWEGKLHLTLWHLHMIKQSSGYRIYSWLLVHDRGLECCSQNQLKMVLVLGEMDHQHHVQNSILESSSNLSSVPIHGPQISYWLLLWTSWRTWMTNNLLPSSISKTVIKKKPKKKESLDITPTVLLLTKSRQNFGNLKNSSYHSHQLYQLS